MGLESGTFVNDLVATNPAFDDNAKQGDDHLRLIKDVLQNTFPTANKAFYFPSYESISGNETVAAADENKWYFVDTSGGNVAVTLPTNLGTSKSGFRVWVQRGASASNTLTVTPSSGTINGAANISITTTYRAVCFVWSGTTWTADELGALAILDTIGTSQIDDSAVTLAKMADLTGDGFIGNNTGGAAAPQELTGTEATALLDAFVGDSGAGGTKGLVPAPSANDADTGKLKLLGAGATWYRPTWHFLEEVGGTGANLTSTANLSGYAMLRIHFWFDASGDDILQMQVASSGPTWLTGTQYDIYANPVYSRMDTGSANSVAEIVSNGAYWRLMDGSVILEAGTAGVTGTLILSQFSAAKNSLLTGDIAHQGTSGGVSYVTVITSIAGVLQSATALTNFRFYWNGGSTFASGSYFAVEGRKFG